MSIRFFKGNSSGVKENSDLPTGQSIALGVNYVFMTGIVKEVISDPANYFNREYVNDVEPATVAEVITGRKLKDEKKITNIENKDMADYLPVNSILVKIIDANNNDANQSDVYCFPFFPPHLCFPLKAGEYVWIVKENVKGRNIYYWMCRKSGIRQVDDVNLTHQERHEGIVDIYNNYFDSQQEIEESEIKSVVNFETPLQSNLTAESFDSIQKKSISFKEEFTPEPVPRYAKKCSDLLLQGSNNAHINLGTDKFGIYHDEQTTPEDFTGKSFTDIIPERTPFSPAIDICIGRKKDDLVNMKFDKNPVNRGSQLSTIFAERDEEDSKILESMEINKIEQVVKGGVVNLGEFHDTSAQNCLARIYMSNIQKIDEVFGLGGGVSPGNFNGLGDVSSIVTYAANNRVAGRESVKLNCVGGGSTIAMAFGGDIVLQSGGGAIIRLGSDGNIEIVPGGDGKVYIGGIKESAKIKPVGTGGAQAGMPEGPPDGSGNILTSAGGLIVEPGGSGKLSKKVRLK
jgi:hypothetical protein